MGLRNATPQWMKMLKEERDRLQGQLSKLRSVLATKEAKVLEREKADFPQPISLKDELYPFAGKIPWWLRPGNVGKVNEVVWPFWFTTEFVEVAANQQVTTSFTITQEASFIMLYYTKAVFLKTGAGAFTNYQYLDPKAPFGAGDATGLSYSFVDAQSTRSFMETTIQLDHHGNARFPTYFKSPQYMRENTALEVTFINGGTDTFVPFLSFFGYRVRSGEMDD